VKLCGEFVEGSLGLAGGDAVEAELETDLRAMPASPPKIWSPVFVKRHGSIDELLHPFAPLRPFGTRARLRCT
jgi:hypothetical protein